MNSNNSLFKILNDLDTSFNNCIVYNDYRSAFLKLYSNFNNFFNGNDLKDKNLVYPLKKYLDRGLNIFLSINEINEFNENFSNFKDEGNTIIQFWNDIVKDYSYKFKGPNIFYIAYCYLNRLTILLNNLSNISLNGYIYLDENGINEIKRIHILYCVFYSDENIRCNMNDNLYMYLEDTFEEFWKIYYNINEINISETSYKLNRLANKSQANLENFIEKYPKIYNFYKNKINDKNNN